MGREEKDKKTEGIFPSLNSYFSLPPFSLLVSPPDLSPSTSLPLHGQELS